jgi:SAM-dependent methyltransferase
LPSNTLTSDCIDHDQMSVHVARNRAYWDDLAKEYVEAGEREWAKKSPRGASGRFQRQNSKFFPSKFPARRLSNWDAVPHTFPLGSHAAVVGIDNSEAQLDTARQLQRQYGLNFPLIHGNAESVPYPDASFDLAISEYGACLWADPHLWVPEAGRLLRPGGQLVFLTNSFLLMLCVPKRPNGGFVP